MITDLSAWIRPHLGSVSLALVATMLVMFGNDINRWVRKHVRKYHFFVRLSIFILLCAAGYGLATIFVTRLIANLLGKVSDHYLILLIVLLFVILGLVAEEKKQL